MTELPRGTVTFLFTDVEGSTRLLKRLRNRYGDVLAQHHELVRDALREHSGHVIDTQGEAFFAAFGRAKDAVAAAVAIQRNHREADWPDGARMRVRIGLHTAEPETTAAGYFGLGVHRAARICSLGHGDQVLVSRSTAGLVDEDEDPSTSLRDLGEHRLKDLDRPERVYQLVSDGLPQDFAPLKSVTELARSTEAAMPSGTVTFLVTDIAGSMKLLRALGPEEYGLMLDAYEELVRAAITDANGRTIEMVGDSVVAAFGRAGDAVRAGVAIQRELGRATWPGGAAPIVQIGAHTGEAQRRKAGYVGLALIRALRVCGAAAGGQVLVSKATESLVDAPALDGAELRDLGTVELGDFEGPARLYAVEWH